MRAFFARVPINLLAALAVVGLATGGCGSGGGGLRLNSPGLIDAGTTISIAANSPEGGVWVQVFDRYGAVILDSKKELRERSDETRVRLFWQVPFNAKTPLRVEATDRTGAKRVRIIRRRS